MKESFKLNDYLGVGYPDLSFHSDEAWKLDYDVLCRHFGMLYCSKYANSEDESFIYIAVNMHWTNHDFAIPKLPKGKKWKIVCSTESGKEKEIEGDCTSINVKERSIIICKGE